MTALASSPERKSILHNSGASLIIRLAGTAASFLVIVGLTRLLSPGDVGRYFVLYSFCSIAAVVIGCGLNLTVVRVISEAFALNTPGRAKQALRTALTMLALASLVFAGVLCLPLAQQLLTHLLVMPLSPALLALLLAWAVGLALQATTGEAFRGMHDIVRASIYGGLAGSLLYLAGLAVFFFGTTASLQGIVAIAASAALVSSAIAGFTLHRRMRAVESSDGPTLRNMAAMSLPFWGTNVVLVVLSQADLWILNQLADSQSVSLYGAAMRLTQFLTMPLLVLNAALIPIISEQHALGETRRLEGILRTSAAAAAIPALVALFTFAVGGSWLLDLLFGPAYREAYWLLLILAAGHCINVLCGSAGYTLLMTGRQREMLWITVASGCAMSVLAWGLGSRFGAPGVAIASALTLAAQSLLMCWTVRRHLGLLTSADPVAMLHPITTLRALA